MPGVGGEEAGDAETPGLLWELGASSALTSHLFIIPHRCLSRGKWTPPSKSDGRKPGCLQPALVLSSLHFLLWGSAFLLGLNTALALALSVALARLSV